MRRARILVLAGRLSMKPGRTLFMRMLSAAYLSANSLVKAASPARNTPTSGTPDRARTPQTVEMLMIAPAFCAA